MRVVGGTVAPADKYPSVAAIVRSDISGVTQVCGGVILTQRHILTAAHCFKKPTTFLVNFKNYKVRVGSTLVHTGGSEHRINLVMFHPKFHLHTTENDLAIMRTETTIAYSKSVQPATIPSYTYRLRDNESMWAVGWGETSQGGYESEQLRHVEVKVINQNTCKTLYKHLRPIDDNALCAGWLNGGGHDQCQRDSGSPLYHKGVVVGIASIGEGCGKPEFPGICVRLSRYASWIRDMTKTGNFKS
ncbi:unnamed protein product [Arctia plantaginis]|uniref:Peptidase S1 domain-containing protein n=1 Tax=Arctia plantaginis TaxID=874455 RepID=A0A8S0Z092_ARCPL|nr:unnamed protein product [Arctia plantaginis]